MASISYNFWGDEIGIHWCLKVFNLPNCHLAVAHG
ncbi:hypothetical protein CFBP1573P_03902 [Pseudomonas syringae pv. persicae]|uniref:Uncharacterized protein n=1 Tax=Pseudomonas syringae pv. persicae TaxID=237306 RepID=A0AB38EQI7_9PSED|nr:hypothetical protein ALO65_200062 [Pseudomonas syringae pv. papulans]SOQ12288.1 hypothetical protein CFBP1573P_03902 [Pseudomonas syringae pv. persicae]SPE17109.1 hypothetical protein PSCFBP2116_P300002 [Pseudomonas syringae]RMN40623.1 hypothetical protein ALQ60_200399 [Pseudomonas syringae pv. papulans]RMV48603.1 hypothetical protein ALP11_200128 [Pseudomonas syringae pv. papulans]